MQIPDFLSHLPVFKGLPVPYTVMWINGIPDFRVIDHTRKANCVMDKRCAICGKNLGEYAWFIGGPKSLVESFLFMDPPQHEHCARFSLQACPFLSGVTTEPNTAKPIPEGAVNIPIVTPTRSAKVGIRRAKLYKPVNVDGYALIQVTKWFGQPIWLA